MQSSVEPIMPGEECWVMGWGLTEGFAESSVLKASFLRPLNCRPCMRLRNHRWQEAQIQVLPHPHCLDIYGPAKIDHSMFCAGEAEGVGANTCKGDSGGALVCGRGAGMVSHLLA